ncbi:MAG: ribose 5-phosphate isomerase B [Firmicutes bacterium]|jgi:ribose 5-phosphate isomerase B|nr:ribose 5-phosphate isomerase B [Bacillota bacterium]
MRIAIGSDHAGFYAKTQLFARLREEGHVLEDFGAYGTDPVDYPDIARAVGEAVASGGYDRGILICGTGIGMSIAANKVPGVRAALCHDEYTARMSRQHNDANVLAIGSRIHATEAIVRIVSVWLATEFGQGRHAERVDKIGQIERSHRGC